MTHTRDIFLFIFAQGTLPNSFQNYYDYNRDFHSYNTRYRNDLHATAFRLDVRKFSIRIAGRDLWNQLPNEIKKAKTIHHFKRKLKYHLVETQTNQF